MWTLAPLLHVNLVIGGIVLLVIVCFIIHLSSKKKNKKILSFSSPLLFFLSLFLSAVSGVYLYFLLPALFSQDPLCGLFLV